jgi:hypothetical protein
MKLLSEDFQAPGAIPQGISEKYTEISKELSTARAKVMGKF